MPDHQITIGELADQVRAKNAGPFWITLDIFLRTDQDYEALLATGVITKQAIGSLYRVEPGSVKIFKIPTLRVIKLSFPRPVTAGSFEDRDLHAGQQHIPLASVVLPFWLPDHGRDGDLNPGRTRGAPMIR